MLRIKKRREKSLSVYFFSTKKKHEKTFLHKYTLIIT